jgi:hypothetical protein
MKVTDLRIGNYVYDLKLNHIIRFISFHGLCNVENRPDDYESIPLTEEILFKCVGFEKIEIMIESGLFYKIYKQDDAWIISLSNGFLIRKLKYLHEFQNIFKELTGKELEINL